MKGIIDGDDGIMYDIALTDSIPSQQKLAKKINKGMRIKFKAVDDPDFNMAIIGPFSF